MTETGLEFGSLAMLILTALLAAKAASLIKLENFGTRFRNRPLLGFAIRNSTGKM
jgi:hypothetical protein